MHDRQSNPIIRFGCYGWDHPRWQTSYFPGDLPADWRLTYFANDAACVMVPAGQFLVRSSAEMGALEIDELHEGFRFYLDASTTGLPSAAIVDSFGGRFAAVISDQLLAALPGTSVFTPVMVTDGQAWANERHALYCGWTIAARISGPGDAASMICEPGCGITTSWP